MLLNDLKRRFFDTQTRKLLKANEDFKNLLCYLERKLFHRVVWQTEKRLYI